MCTSVERLTVLAGVYSGKNVRFESRKMLDIGTKMVSVK